MNRVWATLLVFASLPAFAAPARADIGLKPNDRVHFFVTHAGKPLADAQFVAAVLRYYPAGSKAREKPDNMGAEVPGVNDLPPDPSGARWSYASYKWGGQGADGRVEFHGFYAGMPDDDYDWGVPDQIRVAAYLPSQQKLFLTNVAKTHPLLRTYYVDLQPDGTGTLRLDRTGEVAADWLVGMWQMGMGLALALTLLIEGGVAGVYARSQKRPLTRLLLICFVVNSFSLPFVWVASAIGFYASDAIWKGLVVFVIVELVAAMFEGVLYAKPGRLGWANGLKLALLANAVSVGFGVVSGLSVTWSTTAA